MTNKKHRVDLTPVELGVIQSALRTQEKILSVQSRADVDARERLVELQQLLRSLDVKSAMPGPSQPQCQSWGSMARGLFT